MRVQCPVPPSVLPAFYRLYCLVLLQFIADKVAYALSKGLGVIYCIGEKLEEREANQTLDVNARQMQVGSCNVWVGRLSWESVCGCVGWGPTNEQLLYRDQLVSERGSSFPGKICSRGLERLCASNVGRSCHVAGAGWQAHRLVQDCGGLRAGVGHWHRQGGHARAGATGWLAGWLAGTSTVLNLINLISTFIPQPYLYSCGRLLVPFLGGLGMKTLSMP